MVLRKNRRGLTVEKLQSVHFQLLGYSRVVRFKTAHSVLNIGRQCLTTMLKLFFNIGCFLNLLWNALKTICIMHEHLTELFSCVFSFIPNFCKYRHEYFYLDFCKEKYHKS